MTSLMIAVPCRARATLLNNDCTPADVSNPANSVVFGCIATVSWEMNTTTYEPLRPDLRCFGDDGCEADCNLQITFPVRKNWLDVTDLTFDALPLCALELMTGVMLRRAGGSTAPNGFEETLCSQERAFALELFASKGVNASLCGSANAAVKVTMPALRGGALGPVSLAQTSLTQWSIKGLKGYGNSAWLGGPYGGEPGGPISAGAPYVIDPWVDAAGLPRPLPAITPC
jgi:hypothetical protein